jgi:hypothetical protein
MYYDDHLGIELPVHPKDYIRKPVLGIRDPDPYL